jgi:tetratricopeptide (TPR) repeat protein
MEKLMNSFDYGTTAIVLAAVGLVGGFIYYIFRASAKLTGNLPSTASVLKVLGPALKSYQEGRYREAAQLLPTAIGLFERQGNIPGILGTTNQLGLSLEKLGEYQNAAQAYKSVMQVAFRTEHEESLSLAYRRCCYCQLQVGNVFEAEAAMMGLADEYCRVGYAAKAIGTLVSLADTLRSHGFLSNAAAAYENALALSARLENPNGRASALHDKALFLRSMGKLTEALECVQEAVGIRLGGSDQVSQSHMLSTKTDMLRQLGRITDAQGNYHRALELAMAAGSRRFISLAQLSGSLSAWACGERDQARHLLQLAVLTADEKSQDRRPVHGIIGASYAEQSGDFTAALGVLAVVELETPSMKPHVEAGFLNVQSRALAKTGRLEEADLALKKSYAVVGRLKSPLHFAERALAAGVVSYCRKDSATALTHLQQSLEFFESSGITRQVATTQKYRAAALAALGRSEESAAAREEAKRIFRELGDHASAQEAESFA